MVQFGTQARQHKWLESSLCLHRALLTCVDEVLGRLSGCQCAHQPMRLWQRLHSGGGARPAAASVGRVLPGERLDPGSCLRWPDSLRVGAGDLSTAGQLPLLRGALCLV